MFKTLCLVFALTFITSAYATRYANPQAAESARYNCFSRGGKIMGNGMCSVRATRPRGSQRPVHYIINRGKCKKSKNLRPRRGAQIFRSKSDCRKALGQKVYFLDRNGKCRKAYAKAIHPRARVFYNKRQCKMASGVTAPVSYQDQQLETQEAAREADEERADEMTEAAEEELE